MTAALEKSYDGIIRRRGAPRPGAWLVSRRNAASISCWSTGGCKYGGGPVDRGGDRAGLLPQPAFDQSLPHHRDAVVQRPRARRPRRLHHAALRAWPAAPRRQRAGVRPRPRGDARQRGALLQEGRTDIPRLESQGRGDHRPDFLAGALFRAACRRPSARRGWRRARSAAISSLCASVSRSTW